MSREEELFERKNDELREILEEYEQPTDGNKSDLVSRILHFELGVQPDEAEAEADAEAEATPDEDGEAAANEADDEDTAPEDEAPADEPTEESAEDEGQQALVKFLGGSELHEAKGHRFSRSHPFGVLSEEDANELTREKPKLFRFARPAEADSYYS